MKTSDLIIAVACAGALAWSVFGVKPAKGTAVDAPVSDGAPGDWGGLARANSSQTQLTDAAIAKNWQDTFGALDKTDPAWWV